MIEPRDERDIELWDCVTWVGDDHYAGTVMDGGRVTILVRVDDEGDGLGHRVGDIVEVPWRAIEIDEDVRADNIEAAMLDAAGL